MESKPIKKERDVSENLTKQILNRLHRITKAKKRKAKKKDRGIVDFMMIMHHFFRELPKWIDEMKDPRNLSYTTCTQSDLVLMGLLKNVCAVKTMRSMEEEFNEEACIETLRLLSGDKNLEEMPHYDTLNYYLEKLSPKCLSDVRKKMVKGLIRMKSFYRSKLDDKRRTVFECIQYEVCEVQRL